MTVKVHFDGPEFVPDEPVNLPVGSTTQVVAAELGDASVPAKGQAHARPITPIL